MTENVAGGRELKYRGVDTYVQPYTIYCHNYEDYLEGSKVFLTQQSLRSPPFPSGFLPLTGALFASAHALYAGTYAWPSPTQSNPGVVY